METGAYRSETTLILGGARSGKSRLAEKIIERENKPAIYIATAQAHDDEMTVRIARRLDGLDRTLIRRIFDSAPEGAVNLGLGEHPAVALPACSRIHR